VFSFVTVAANIQHLLAEVVFCGRVIQVYWSTEAARATAAHSLSNISRVAQTVHWLDTCGVFGCADIIQADVGVSTSSKASSILIKASISKSQTFSLAERAYVSYRCARVRTAASPRYVVPGVQTQVTSLLVTRLCSCSCCGGCGSGCCGCSCYCCCSCC